jgi:hypothetical protein
MTPARTLLLAALISLVAASVAVAHVERPSYFPDPAPDTQVSPAAGGERPKARSLASALNKKLPGRTRVVCQPDSLKRLKASIGTARRDGYLIRPTDRRKLSKKAAKKLLAVNKKLRKLCKFREIQPAVMATGNNDRVVVMPGLYLEPTARAKPTNDPACEKFRTNGDKPGEEGNALSYAYQFNCPNDQNLIAVIGRELGTGTDPVPPREDRTGIPNLGKCIRCNVQLEGSGVSADDVVIDAGDESKGNKGPNGVGSKKDVAVRADRADGFVFKNATVRHAGEHGLYVLETDGYLLDRFKAYYSKLYGTLTFASDHGRQSNCEGVGHGDSALYPGGAPETGVQRPTGTAPRLNQELTLCDLHHNMSGVSGTNGNGVHVHHNNIYDNSLGLTTDIVTAAGHPGFPGDSMLIEKNNFYSNNFNLYEEKSDVEPAFPFPIGTGMWIAGGNHHTVRENYFYDNWRRGTMVFTVPDALVCGPAAEGNQQAGCEAGRFSVSHYNEHADNFMGMRPDGKTDINGVDFWWDQFPGARGNCWFRNVAPEGRTVSTSPSPLPNCDDGKDPASSIGTGNLQNESELGSCAIVFETRDFDPNGPCPWVRAPADPGDGGKARSSQSQSAASETFDRLAAPVTRMVNPNTTKLPLGQATCTDWRRTPADARPAFVQRLRDFLGGVVNDGEQNIGNGAVLTYLETVNLYEGWCSRHYARGFLLYKLYSFAAAFGHRH